MWLFKRNSEKLEPKKQESPKELNIDNQEFLISRDGILREYRGEQDSFIVPRGVLGISNVEDPISRHSIDTIYIPRTVRFIGEAALAYCESVYYEGSEAEWKKITISSDNFQTGWRPDWCKEPPLDKYRVTEVKFHFNYAYAWEK